MSAPWAPKSNLYKHLLLQGQTSIFPDHSEEIEIYTNGYVASYPTQNTSYSTQRVPSWKNNFFPKNKS